MKVFLESPTKHVMSSWWSLESWEGATPKIDHERSHGNIEVTQSFSRNFDTLCFQSVFAIIARPQQKQTRRRLKKNHVLKSPYLLGNPEVPRRVPRGGFSGVEGPPEI